MEKITSFTVNHCTMTPGIYISRIDDDIVTYDLRFIKPNTPPFLEVASMHTIEHLFATFVRNSDIKDKIIYFGPMGCRTGFYLLVRSSDHKKAIELIKDVCQKTAEFEGEIPGATEIECGNYKEHNLDGAKEYCKNYYETIKNWDDTMLKYKDYI